MQGEYAGSEMPGEPCRVRKGGRCGARQVSAVKDIFQLDSCLCRSGFHLCPPPSGCWLGGRNPPMSCLSWNWRGRSSVKITERTHGKTEKALHRYPSGERRRCVANFRRLPLTSWSECKVLRHENVATFNPGEAFFQRQELCYFLPLSGVAEISEIKSPTSNVLQSGEARFE